MQDVPRNNVFFSRDNTKRRPQPSTVCRTYVKAWHWIIGFKSTRFRQGNPLLLGNVLKFFPWAPITNLVYSIFCQQQRNWSTKQLKDLKPVFKKHTVLDKIRCRTAFIDTTKYSGEFRKQVFYQEVINDQIPKLRLQINDIEIVIFVDIGPDETKVSLRSGYTNWTLQEVNVQLLGIKAFSHIKQSVVWV